MVLRTKARTNMYQEKNKILVNLVPLVVLATLVILVDLVNYGESGESGVVLDEAR